MIRKYIPARYDGGRDLEAEAQARREEIIRELSEMARTGGRQARQEFEEELKAWNEKRPRKIERQPSKSILFG
jgi:hypothetical protein